MWNNPLKYIDPSGHKVEGYIGVHRVVYPFYHTSIVIFVDKDSKYWNHEAFSNYDEKRGMRYVTIGAGPVDGKLISGLNRERDVNLELKAEMLSIKMDDDKTGELLEREQYFSKNSENAALDYDLFPGISDSYNSNSFVSGILRAAGYNDQDIPKPSKNVPGFDKPVPFYYFYHPIYLDPDNLLPDTEPPSVTDSVFH